MAELEGVMIFNLAKKVAERKTDNEHLKAVQAQVQVANQIYFAIFRMVADQNGLAAESLLRTLFDTAVNCVILAKHKDKLLDFIRNGQFTHLQLIRFTEVVPERVKPLVAATEDDWKILSPEFKSTEWHKLKTRDSFVEAECKPEMYDKYFRRASSYAHGEPFITVRRTDDTWKNWIVEARPENWKILTIGAYGLACDMMLHMLVILNREFKLGIDEEFAKPIALVQDLKVTHIALMQKQFAHKDKKAGPHVQPNDKAT